MNMSELPSPGLWSTVAALPDYLLLSQTRELSRHEQPPQILVLDQLLIGCLCDPCVKQGR